MDRFSQDDDLKVERINSSSLDLTEPESADRLAEDTTLIFSDRAAAALDVQIVCNREPITQVNLL